MPTIEVIKPTLADMNNFALTEQNNDDIAQFASELDPFLDVDSLDDLFPSIFDDIENEKSSEVLFDKGLIDANSEGPIDGIAISSVSSHNANVVSDDSTCANTTFTEDDENTEASADNRKQTKRRTSKSSHELQIIDKNEHRQRKRCRQDKDSNGCLDETSSTVIDWKMKITSDNLDVHTVSDDQSQYDRIETMLPIPAPFEMDCFDDENQDTSNSNYYNDLSAQSRVVSPFDQNKHNFQMNSNVCYNGLSNPSHGSLNSSNLTSAYRTEDLPMYNNYHQNQGFCNMQMNSYAPNMNSTFPTMQSLPMLIQNLNDAMTKSELSQSRLEEHDRANGLPKSHSQTMVKSARSRKQLQKGIILSKWDGSPLIAYDPGKGWVTNAKRRRKKTSKIQSSKAQSQN